MFSIAEKWPVSFEYLSTPIGLHIHYPTTFNQVMIVINKLREL